MKKMKKSNLIILVVLAVVLFVVLPQTGSNYILNTCTLMCLYLAMSQMWNLLGGYAGMLSLGMQAFIGIGGYTLTSFIGKLWYKYLSVHHYRRSNLRSVRTGCITGYF